MVAGATISTPRPDTEPDTARAGTSFPYPTK
jgi:hypothetical protein